MLGIGAAFDVFVCRSAHFLAQLKLQNGKVCNGAVVHETVPAEDERVIVDWRDRRPARCTYVSHEDTSLCIGANRAEVQIVRRGLDTLVHGRSQAFFPSAVSRFTGVASLEVGIRRRVPDNTYAVDVVDHIAGSNQVVLGDITRIMCYQSWKEVLMDLVRERVLGRDDHVFEQTWLRRGDVCEPASSVSFGDTTL